MATNIPPHNLREVIDATLHLIDHPDADRRGPHAVRHRPRLPDRRDDPRPRRHHRVLPHRPRLDPHARGRRDRGSATAACSIVVTEVPYQTSVEVIGQKIAELVNDRRIEGIRDVRNESAGDTVRLVVDLKRDANAQVVLNQLYKHTPMQTNFAANVLALVDGVPAAAEPRAGAERLRRAPDRGRHPAQRVPAEEGARPRAHRRGSVARARHDRRDHHVDPWLRVGRRGPHRVDGRRRSSSARCRRRYILDMQLRRLAALEHQKLRDEFDELAEHDRRARGDPRRRAAKLRGVIKDELGDDPRQVRRRAPHAHHAPTPASSPTSTSSRTKSSSSCSRTRGYVKTVPVDQFRTQGRGGKGVRGGNLRDEDYVEHLLTTHRALVPVVLLEPRAASTGCARTRSR